MFKQAVAGIFALSMSVQSISAQPLATPGEACAYSRFTQHDDIDQFLSALIHRSHTLVVQEIGKTRPVENLPATPLLLCVITAEGVRRPEQLDRRKPTILIIASQHGSEQSGKEAALLLIRDLTMGDLQGMLDQANFLILPQANPYGNRFDQRTNEMDWDMNRDHIKLESEGAQAVHRVFRAWMPEVTLDVHERSENYYQIAQGCVSNINIDPVIQDYSRRVILASVQEALAKEKITFHEYLVTSENMPGDASGADFCAQDLAGQPMITRYSTSDINDCRNSLGIYQTFSFIQEAASRYDLQTLSRRTDRQFRAIRAFLRAVLVLSAEITTKVNDLRKQLLKQTETIDPANPIPIKMEYRQDEQQPELRLRQFQRSAHSVLGVLKVDKRAGEAVMETELESQDWPAQRQVITKIETNWYPHVVATRSVVRPLGYIIPANQQEVITTLRRHDIEILTFSRDCTMKVEGYLTKQIIPAKHDYLAPESLRVEPQALSTICKKGDFFISCHQPAANLAPCLLEPESDYGLIRYWKYRLTPQVGEYFAIFRVMMEQNPPLIPFADW